MDLSRLGLYKCSNCSVSIKEIIFTCKECPQIELCLQCYICRVEIGPHISSHSVKAIDIATFSLFTNPREIKIPPKRTSFRQLAKASPEKKREADTPEPFSNARVWKASDELALLDALEQFGYGRWKDIQAVLSQSMNGITCEEIQEHYLVHYIFTNITKRPPHWRMAIQQIAAIFENYNNLTMQDQNAPNDENQPSVIKEELSRLRYFPKRDEFVVEYDNEAEAEMDNYIWKLQGDEAVRKEFILAILRVYNSRLKNRFRMKAAVKKCGLIEKFCEGGNALTEGSTDSNERDQPKATEIKPKGRWPKISQTLNEKLDEQDFTRLFTPFELFADKPHLESLYHGLKREMALKQGVRKFCQYKRHRLMDMEAIRQFEEDRYQKREKRRKYKKAIADESSDEEESLLFNIDHLKKLWPQTMQKGGMANLMSTVSLSDLSNDRNQSTERKPPFAESSCTASNVSQGQLLRKEDEEKL